MKQRKNRTLDNFEIKEIKSIFKENFNYSYIQLKIFYLVIFFFLTTQSCSMILQSPRIWIPLI